MISSSLINKSNFKFKMISDLYIGVLFTIILVIILIIIKRVFFELFEYNKGTDFLIESEGCGVDGLSFCNLTDDYQFDKFINLYIEDIQLPCIIEINNLLRNHSHEYTIYSNKIRSEYEMIKTSFTGRDNNKVNLKMMKDDSFFTSFYRKYGKKIHLYGTSSSFLDSLLFFNDILYEDANIKDLHPSKKEPELSNWLTSKNHGNFLNHVNELSKSNISLILFVNGTESVQVNQDNHSNV